MESHEQGCRLSLEQAVSPDNALYLFESLAREQELCASLALVAVCYWSNLQWGVCEWQAAQSRGAAWGRRGSASMDACSAGGVPGLDGSCTNACLPPGWTSLVLWSIVGSNQWFSFKNFGGIGPVWFVVFFPILEPPGMKIHLFYPVLIGSKQGELCSLLTAALGARSAASKAPTCCVGTV